MASSTNNRAVKKILRNVWHKTWETFLVGMTIFVGIGKFSKSVEDMRGENCWYGLAPPAAVCYLMLMFFYLKAKSASEIEIGENKNYNFRCYKSWNVKRAPRRNYKQHRICAIVSFIHSCVSIPFGTAGNGGKLWIMNSTNFLLVFIARAFSSDNRIFAL